MREIKFRAWLVEDEVMIQSDRLCFEQFLPLKNLLNYNNDIQKIMQYTGLKDKNGVEIYEGDILIAKNKQDSKNNDWIGIVEENNFGWLALKYKEYINPSWLGALSTPMNEPQTATWIINNCEVIGNIYENPELLN